MATMRKHPQLSTVAELLLLGNKLTTLENIIHTIGSDRVALEYHARYLDF